MENVPNENQERVALKESETIVSEFDLKDTRFMPKGKSVYPSLLINEKMTDDDENLPIVLTVLEDGTLPILIDYKGEILEVKTIKRDLVTINKLLVFYPVTLALSETERIQLKSITELVEIEAFPWGD